MLLCAQGMLQAPFSPDLHRPTVRQLLGTHRDQAISKGPSAKVVWLLHRASLTFPPPKIFGTTKMIFFLCLHPFFT